MVVYSFSHCKDDIAALTLVNAKHVIFSSFFQKMYCTDYIRILGADLYFSNILTILLFSSQVFERLNSESAADK